MADTAAEPTDHGQPMIQPTTQPSGSPTVSTAPPNEIAQRRGTVIGLLDKGTRGDAPDEQGLAKIAGLLRKSAGRGDVDKAAETEDRIEHEALQRHGGRAEAALQDVVAENARLLQVRVQILQTVADAPARS